MKLHKRFIPPSAHRQVLASNVSFFQIKQANFAVILNKYDPKFANFRSKIKEIEDKIKDVRNVGFTIL